MSDTHLLDCATYANDILFIFYSLMLLFSVFLLDSFCNVDHRIFPKFCFIIIYNKMIVLEKSVCFEAHTELHVGF